MKGKLNLVNVIKFAGAYVALIIGSGFATGQEIMQFFTSNGFWSIGSVIISLIIFTYFGSTIMGSGYDHKGVEKHSAYKYFCGKHLGRFYEIFIPILLFATVVIMISGAGATLKEYYGLNYYIGCALMTILILVAYIFGLNNLINVVGLIGPVIILFSMAVGLIILFQNIDGLKNVTDIMQGVEIQKAGGGWIRSGIIYATYNLLIAVLFFTTLGQSADNRKEAVYGGIVGSIAIMLVILIMNLALLSKVDSIQNLSIPTLYFAESISPILGKFFSVILLCGIFSTAAPDFWTVCTTISKEDGKNSKLVAVLVAVFAFLGGLLPFEMLVGKIYPYAGYLGVVLIICILGKQVNIKQVNKEKEANKTII